MLWRNTRFPYTTTRLWFKGTRNINRAWQAAQELRLLLIRAGNYRRRDMQILAFGVAGALQAFNAEYHIKISTERKVIEQAIAQITRRS
jgi:hypothetical protein